MGDSSYTDELAVWIKKRSAKKRRQDEATVAFLAVHKDVAAALNSGYAVSTIYEHMRETGRIRSSYETFRKHVRRFLKPSPEPVQQEGKSEARKSKAPERAGIAGFSFDPKPNKEELL